MDVGAEFTIPNPYALLPSDFDRDTTSYQAALKFLGDLSSGSDHDAALTGNGGDPAMLISWKRSPKFRRVYAKCRAAGDAEREALAARESDAADTEDAGVTEPRGQRFVALEDVPAVCGVFSLNAGRESWGGA